MTKDLTAWAPSCPSQCGSRREFHESGTTILSGSVSELSDTTINGLEAPRCVFRACVRRSVNFTLHMFFSLFSVPHERALTKFRTLS